MKYRASVFWAWVCLGAVSKSNGKCSQVCLNLPISAIRHVGAGEGVTSGRSAVLGLSHAWLKPALLQNCLFLPKAARLPFAWLCPCTCTHTFSSPCARGDTWLALSFVQQTDVRCMHHQSLYILKNHEVFLVCYVMEASELLKLKTTACDFYF